MSTVLITGASSGIGADFAHVFAANGHHLALVARREDKLMTVAKSLKDQFGTEIEIITQDLGKTGAARELFDKVQSRGLKLQGLVNNAGLGVHGKFHEVSFEKTQNMNQVNMMALSELCHLFIPELLKNPTSYILNVASTASFQAGPYMAAYFATKAFVLSLSEALHEEYKKNGLKVSCLCPGPTKTEFFTAAEMDGSSLTKPPMMTSREVAEIGYKGLINNRAINVAGFMNWFTAMISSASPHWITRALTAKILKP